MSTTTNPFTPEWHAMQIKRSIENELNAISEPILKKAMEDIERETRRRLGGIVVGMLDRYSVTQRGMEILITVKRDGEEP